MNGRRRALSWELTVGCLLGALTSSCSAIAADVIADAAVDVIAEAGTDAETNEEAAAEATGTVVVRVEAKAGSDAVSKLFKALVPSFRSGEAKQDPPAGTNTNFSATHRQVGLLKVTPTEPQEGEASETNFHASWAVKSFCLNNDDNLLVAVGDSSAGELQLLDTAGERQRSWRMPVVPEAINVHPDGSFLVAGAGKLFKLDGEGEVVLEAISPLLADLEENKEKFRQQVIQQMKAQAKSMERMRDSYQDRIDKIVEKAALRLDRDERSELTLLKRRLNEFEEQDSTELTAEEQNAWALRRVLLRMLETKVEQSLTKREIQMRDVYRKQMEQFAEMAERQGNSEPTDEQIDAAVKSQIAYKSRFASISATDEAVFIATGSAQGYGYDVWRFDAKLENPEKVVTQLRGCCGQMDVQACEAGLFVAENSRHQVRHFDFDGEKVNEWGGREREGVKGFGSCCNPMNVAFGPDGTVYTAESNSGRIKRYSAEGQLMELIGSVELVPGCKKVSIAVTKDQQRVYMLDITRNHIIIMEAKPDEEQVVSNEEVKAAS